MSVLISPFATERGNELALADDVGTLTFAEPDARINQMVHAMRDAGLSAGDTIGLVAGNCNEWFITALACANSGIVFVPINWHRRGSKVRIAIHAPAIRSSMARVELMPRGRRLMAASRPGRMRRITTRAASSSS